MDTKKPNAECFLKRNWIKCVLGLNILLGKPPEALHRELGFQNRQHELLKIKPFKTIMVHELQQCDPVIGSISLLMMVKLTLN
jgi:hypothetical protein